MFDKEGFITAVNNMKQRPRTEWLDFAKNMYQSKNQNYTEVEQQGMQIMKNNPQIPQFLNMINSQFGIKF